MYVIILYNQIAHHKYFYTDANHSLNSAALFLDIYIRSLAGHFKFTSKRLSNQIVMLTILIVYPTC